MTAPRSPGPSVTPQDVLSPLTDAAMFLVATVHEGGEPAVRDLLEDLSALQRSVGFRLPAAKLSCVTGIGSDLWDRLFTGPRPAQLHRFRQWKGPKHTAPSTPGDLRRMFLGDPYGNYDRILDFSTALTGSLYFVPTGDFLDDLPD
jgi:porphyrinogen peroxidase